MIFIIGQHGQVAQALKQMDPARVQCLSRDECDLSQPESLEKTLLPIFQSGEIEALINAGAYTQVDQAESDQKRCHLMNAVSPGILAKLCADHQVPFIHYSSDYVYGSNGAELLIETSPCHPLNFYAKAKYEGDQAILAVNGRALILRTSWVYDHQGKNFFTTMMNLFKTRETLNVVADQVGAPTYALDIASITFQLLEPLKKFQKTEIVHLTNTGHMSWQQFSQLILNAAKKHNLPIVTQTIQPILTSEWPTPAKRQLNSRLSLEKLKTEFGIIPRSVEAALEECLKHFPS